MVWKSSGSVVGFLQATGLRSDAPPGTAESTPSSLDTGAALERMLRYFTEFNYGELAVAPSQSAGTLPKHTLNFFTGRPEPIIAVEDPQVPGRDIGGAIKRWMDVLAAFHEALDILAMNLQNPLQRLLNPLRSPLPIINRTPAVAPPVGWDHRPGPGPGR